MPNSISMEPVVALIPELSFLLAQRHKLISWHRSQFEKVFLGTEFQVMKVTPPRAMTHSQQKAVIKSSLALACSNSFIKVSLLKALSKLTLQSISLEMRSESSDFAS